jgi:enoyl-CoA hydratase/3-hydroxyacyl-CoA dehydrogenase
MAALDDGDLERARIETDGHRADVVIDRPDKRNAMNPQVIADLTTAFERVSGADGVRAVTLLGAGEVFCAGMDLNMMRERVEDGSDLDRDAFPDLLDAVASCEQPVVAGIKRAGPAGAFELTLPCDMRVLGEDARYGVIEVQLGTFPHGGATQRLPRLVGLSKAKEIVLTGEFVDPEEAHDIGLVHEVCPDEEVDARARALADDLCSNAPLGLRNAKRALDAAPEMPLDEGLALERSLGRELDDTADYREGFDARLEGRDPEFQGE